VIREWFRFSAFTLARRLQEVHFHFRPGASDQRFDLFSSLYDVSG